MQEQPVVTHSTVNQEAPEELPSVAAESVAETVITLVELNAAEYRELIGLKMAIVKMPDGRYVGRFPERKLSKDDVINILVQQNKK